MNSRPRRDFQALANWPAQPIHTEAKDMVTWIDEWPLVSLVTPSFNQADYLEACIQSVLHQKYPNLEHFIMDGGSTDSSLTIIQRYEEHLTGWTSQPDSGQADAVNQGWRKSTGKYLWWLNSDDMLTPQSILTSVAYLEQNPDIDMVYGDIVRIDREGRINGLYRYPPFDLAELLLEGMDIPQAGTLMRRSVLDEVGFLNPQLHFVMDLEFWQRIALSGKTIRYIPQALAMFRVYDESKTQAGSERAIEERRMVAQKVLTHPNCPDEVKRNKRRVWFNVEMACSRTWIKQGRFNQAIQTTLNAVRTYPISLLSGRVYYLLFVSILGRLLGWKRWITLRSRVRVWRRGRS